MAEATAIEWCDATFNPWIGCSKVSPGCDNCYAEAQQDKRLHHVRWGAGQPRLRTNHDTWRKPFDWNAWDFRECACGWRGTRARCQTAMSGQRICPQCRQELFSAMRKTRMRVFCASLSDVFDNQVPTAWRLELLDVIRRTPSLNWLLLTKRVGNVVQLLAEALELYQKDMLRMQSEAALGNWLASWIDGEPPANVWLGATVVNQEEVNRDVPKLLAAPAAVRFLSMEPLLGQTNLADIPDPAGGVCLKPLAGLRWVSRPTGRCTAQRHARIDWVIVGAESGRYARPMHPDWPRSLRDQCAAAAVPFLFKQWGEWNPGTVQEAVRAPGIRIERSGAVHPWPPLFDPGSGDWCMRKVGKKAAGRLLDGVLHNAFPTGER